MTPKEALLNEYLKRKRLIESYIPENQKSLEREKALAHLMFEAERQNIKIRPEDIGLLPESLTKDSVL